MTAERMIDEARSHATAAMLLLEEADKLSEKAALIDAQYWRDNQSIFRAYDTLISYLNRII